jgi:hypothetical protein
MSIGITTENQSAGIPIFSQMEGVLGCHFMRFPVIYSTPLYFQELNSIL